MASQVKFTSGNIAVAEAIKRIDIDVVSAYPITPQTHVVEYISVLRRRRNERQLREGGIGALRAERLCRCSCSGIQNIHSHCFAGLSLNA